jgi:uncharacterized repeat protein (TIGR03803 family)
LFAPTPRLSAQTASFTEATFPAGAQPISSLLQAKDGNIYGVTYSGGTDGYGLIYQLTAAGQYTALYSFTGGTTDGGSPAAGLVEGPDGALYGTTTLGGANGLGTIFRFTSAGISVLHSFDPNADGNSPYAALTLANDGNMYGILAQGPFDSSTGNYSGGTIFSISPGGTFHNLYQFPEDDSLGSFSTARLLQASDGNFWGVTSSGGSNGYGALFNWNATQGLAVHHNFTLAEGSPVYGLAQSGSSLYGVTFPFYGGQGEIFAVALSGHAYSITYTFTGASDGGSPATALYPGSDGNLYGATQSGGTNADGTFFRLSSTGQPVTLLNFPAGSLNTFADAALLEASNTGFYLPLLYDSTPGLPPSSMDGAGTLLLLEPAYSTTPPAPVAFTSSSSTILPNHSATLAWSLPNSASLTSQQCFAFTGASNPATVSWSGQKSASGSQAFTLSTGGTYTFALNCGGSQNSLAQITVSNATQTTLSAPASVQQGQSATLSATVTATASGAPTGTIQFLVNGSIQLKTVPLASGTATFTASTRGVPVGSYSVQAIYSGDSTYAASTSAASTVHVTAAQQSTTTAMTASPQTLTPGTRVTLTATVTSASGTPSGSVNFYYRTIFLGTATLNSGVASLTASSSGVPLGTYGVDAVYSGSASYLPSTSAIVNITVN